MKQKNLPGNWVKTSIKEIANIQTGKLDANAAENNGKYPFFTCADEVSKINTYSFDTEAVLLAGNGSFGVKWFNGKFNAYQRTYVIEPAIINGKFLYYAFLDLIPKIIEKSRGSTIKYLRIGDIQDTEFFLPPLAEQQRIVAKLEEVLSDLDAGVEELKTAQTKLVQYRQSLLKSAVEGTLTAEWRRKNSLKETGEELLQRILKERRIIWEEKQLSKYEEQGKVPPKSWQDKYPEPLLPDTKDLPELPDGWIWTSLDMLGEIVSGVAKGTKRDSSIVVRDVPYLRVANVQRGYLDLSEIKTIYATEKDIQELTLKYGDILFNEGGDRDKLGRGWIWRDEVENCIHQNHVFRMRPFLSEIVPELVSHYGNTFGKTWFQSAGKQTTNLASINMSILRSFPVPLAPADEQLEILSILNSQVQLLEMQEQATKKALLQSDAQRKNVLKSAFSGQLISQNSGDEPASVLLERIQSERLESSLVKTLKVKGRKQMKKNIHESLQEWIINRDDKPFTFEEINKSIFSEYEQIKDAIYVLLSEKTPIIEQVFDEDLGLMRFKRPKQ